MTNLFSEYTIKGKTIKNRLVFPPVVCFNYAGEDGMPTDRNVAHYLDYSKADIGLIIIEATCINPNGKLHKTQLGIWDDKFIPKFKEIADNCKKHGNVSLVQIHHAGVLANFAPSEYMLKDKVVRGMTKEEVEITIDEFAEAAKRCYKAGFDGIEVHAAHGYLISQFMSRSINKREDEYGLDKSLFGVRIIEEIKKKVPEDFIIAVRMGANDPDVSTSVEYAKKYVEAGADLLHVSTGFAREIPADYKAVDEDYHYVANLGILIKKALPDVPVISVFGIDTPQMADELIKRGHVDFAASARGLLSDYNWLSKYKNGEEVVTCKKCKSCLWREDGALCPARLGWKK